MVLEIVMMTMHWGPVRLPKAKGALAVVDGSEMLLDVLRNNYITASNKTNRIDFCYTVGRISNRLRFCKM